MHHKSMYLHSMYSKELLKGTLVPIILKLLSERGKMYGYQIAQEVKEMTSGKILIKEGSLYPALHKLQTDGLVDVESASIGKRVRKYYTISKKGKSAVVIKLEELNDFMETIVALISNGEQLKPNGTK